MATDRRWGRGRLLTKPWARRCQAQACPVEELTVSPIDPLRFWCDFTGSCEVAGLLASRQSLVLLIRGGELLPVSSIAVHLSVLQILCQAAKVTVLVPLFRSQEGALEAVLPGFARSRYSFSGRRANDSATSLS